MPFIVYCSSVTIAEYVVALLRSMASTKEAKDRIKGVWQSLKLSSDEFVRGLQLSQTAMPMKQTCWCAPPSLEWASAFTRTFAHFIHCSLYMSLPMKKRSSSFSAFGGSIYPVGLLISGSRMFMPRKGQAVVRITAGFTKSVWWKTIITL